MEYDYSESLYHCCVLLFFFFLKRNSIVMIVGNPSSFYEQSKECKLENSKTTTRGFSDHGNLKIVINLFGWSPLLEFMIACFQN